MGKETGKMRSGRLRMMITLGFSFLLILGFGKIALAMGKGPEVPRMTKEELLPLLGSADVIILDGRIGDEWKKSPWKIKGAVRVDTEKGVKALAQKYPKDKTYVLY
jgi:cytochrome bd-type quinol oxidase subunit 1